MDQDSRERVDMDYFSLHFGGDVEIGPDLPYSPDTQAIMAQLSLDRMSEEQALAELNSLPSEDFDFRRDTVA